MEKPPGEECHYTDCCTAKLHPSVETFHPHNFLSFCLAFLSIVGPIDYCCVLNRDLMTNIVESEGIKVSNLSEPPCS